MAEDLKVNKRIETIHIVAKTCAGFKNQKGEGLTVTFKFEYGDRLLGESNKVETAVSSPEGSTNVFSSDTEVNFATTLPINCEDATQLDDISSKPVVVTAQEVMPKEKKQKDEKVVLLGQAVFSLEELLSNAKSLEFEVPFHPAPGSPLESLKGEEIKPSITCHVYAEDPLLTESQLKTSNMMKIQMGRLYAPPESWQVNGPPYQYISAVSIPHSGERDQTLVFQNGTLKPSIEKEPSDKRVRWYNPGKAVGGAVFMPSSKQVIATPSSFIADEDGDLRAEIDTDFRRAAEVEKPRAVWNTEKISYLDAAADLRLQQRIAQNRFIPVEVMRVTPPGQANAKKGGGAATKTGADDDTSIYFHGVAYVDMAPLLYPGNRKIKGVYRVEPFIEPEVAEKTGMKGSSIAEVSKVVFGVARPTSPHTKKDAKKSDSKKKEKSNLSTSAEAKEKETSTQGRSDESKTILVPDVPTTISNPEGQMYHDSRSHLYLEIELTRPLIKARTIPDQVAKLAEVIPARPACPKYIGGADESVASYKAQLKSIASQVIDEYRGLFRAEMLEMTKDVDNQARAGEITPQEAERRKQQLMYELNVSGKYFAFKEQLKYTVVKIVREKFLRRHEFQDDDERQTFLSHLFVFLIDEMHIALNEFLTTPESSPSAVDTLSKGTANGLTDPAMTLRDPHTLRMFADEAAQLGDWELASRYHQELVALDKNEACHWFNYGVHAIAAGDLVKAEECLRECLSLSPTHFDCLITCGVVCTLQGHYDAARACLETAVTVDPSDTRAWLILSYFYEAVRDYIGYEMALGEAERIHSADINSKIHTALSTAPAPSAAGPTTAAAPPIADDTASVAGNEKRAGAASKMGGMAEKRKPQSRAPSVSRENSAKATRKSVRLLSSTTYKSDVSEVEGFGASGPQRRASKLPKHQQQQREVSRKRDEPIDGATANTSARNEIVTRILAENDSLHLKVARFLLKYNLIVWAEKSLSSHLLLQKGGTQKAYNEMFSICLVLKGNLDAAIVHMQEAVKTDFRSAEAFAALGNAYFDNGQRDEAMPCLERALAFEQRPSDIRKVFMKLGQIYLQRTEYDRAKDMFLLAVQKFPSCPAWLGIGIACFRQGDFSDAEDALCEANLLNPYCSRVWAYLSMCCLRTGRKLEAEQSYKFAIKTSPPLQSKARKFPNIDGVEDIFVEVHELQKTVGFGNPSF